MRSALCCVAAVLALVAAAPAAAGTGMFVGAAEDQARSLDPVDAKAKMDLAALAGLQVVRMTAIWAPGSTTLGDDDRAVLKNAVAAARLDGVRLLLSIYPRDRRTTPLTSRARGEFAQFAASIARTFPQIADFVVGNEPNLNLFWMPQFGRGGVDLAARAYELLLATTYDALKSVSPDVNVIGGALSPRGQDKPGSARQTHSPTAFIADLGAAYRASGRRKPLMDMFAIHPYLIPSRLPPTFAHPRSTTIGVADYPKLVQLLTRAFAGTAQAGATLPIVYDEFGYQSQIPPAKRSAYTHLDAPAAQDAIPEAQQAAYYREAVALVACQPTVAGLLLFHVTDESDARAWQSGLYYSDGTPKSSLPAVRDAALAAQAGTLAGCAKATSTLGAVAFHEPSATRALDVDLSCAVECSWQVQVIDAQTAETVATATGVGVGEQTATLAADDLEPGSYQYVLRVFRPGSPGTGETRTSTAFALAPPPLPSTDPVADEAPLSAVVAPSPPLPTLVPTVP